VIGMNGLPSEPDRRFRIAMAWLFGLTTIGVACVLAWISVVYGDSPVLASLITTGVTGWVLFKFAGASRAGVILLADGECALKIRDLWLGGDVSDPRLGRLNELPKVRSILLLSASDPERFIERFRGSATVEELTLVFCRPSREVIPAIAGLPKLKKLGFCTCRWDDAEWDTLRKALPNCECKRVESNR
jgi:hypothetical protein